MPDESHSDSRDKVRLCPTCRMAISVLATKCRFCGEPVGRPRDESRTLTVNDLGGSAASNFAPSEDVLEAIEAFRQEEIAQHKHVEEESEGWFSFLRRGKKAAEAPARSANDLPELDARGRELASIGGSSVRRKPSRRVTREQIVTRKLMMGAAAIAALVILYFGAMSVKASIDRYREENKPKPPEVVNRAVDILAANGRGVDALRAAREALAQADTPKNRDVMDQARKKIRSDVESKLNAVPWTRDMLYAAGRMTSEALEVDPASQDLRALKDEVDKEIALYTLTIDRIDFDAGTVTIRIAYPKPPSEVIMYRRGDKIKDRLSIEQIGQKYVVLEDRARKAVGNLPRRVTLSIDGTVSAR